MLYVRHRLGEFDPAASNPFRDPQTYNVSKLTPSLQRLSLDAARQSIVLLKSTAAPPFTSAAADDVGPVLPLDPKRYKKLALVGIDGAMFAGYNTADLSIHVGVPGMASTDRITTVADVLREEKEFEIASAVGCGCKAAARHNHCFPHCDEYDGSSVAVALDGAALAVVFIGLGGEEGENHDLRDLELPGNQSRLIDDVLATELPIVLVLLTCNPLNISALHRNPQVVGIVQAFYPQFFGGQAIADVLTGKWNPSGRLPYSWPQGDGSLVAGSIANYSMLGTNKTYRYASPTDTPPLFPFGYGLGFSSFNFSSLQVTGDIPPCSNVTVSVDVSNIHGPSGSCTVQLYLRWMSTDLPPLRPRLQLVNFEKVWVASGATVSVSLVIDARHMAVLRPAPTSGSAEWQPPLWSVEPGLVEVFIGDGQPGFASSQSLTGTFNIAGTATPVKECSVVDVNGAQSLPQKSPMKTDDPKAFAVPVEPDGSYSVRLAASPGYQPVQPSSATTTEPGLRTTDHCSWMAYPLRRLAPTALGPHSLL